MRQDWIFEDNLRPFLISLGWFVGYAFDDYDWIAIDHRIESTNQENDRWFEYEFVGTSSARFHLAREPGTTFIHLRIEVPPEVEPRVDAAIVIFQSFRLMS